MLLSHKYKFIFMKTRKTAGTSIEVDFSQFMGPEDIVTEIWPPVAGHAPRNCATRNPLHRLMRKSWFNHMPARMVRDLAGRAVFDSYFKFCVEREPVAKTISMYQMIATEPTHAHYEPGLSWEAYVERGRFPVDPQIILDRDGSLMVDLIVKYEKLGEGLAEVAQRLGLPFTGLKAKAKSGSGAGEAKVAKPRIEPTPQQCQRIYDAFAPTLAFTGYSI